VIIAAADVSGDRQVTSLDALMMRRLVLLHFQGFTTTLMQNTIISININIST
jgi:hypothetical protein